MMVWMMMMIKNKEKLVKIKTKTFLKNTTDELNEIGNFTLNNDDKNNVDKNNDDKNNDDKNNVDKNNVDKNNVDKK